MNYSIFSFLFNIFSRQNPQTQLKLPNVRFVKLKVLRTIENAVFGSTFIVNDKATIGRDPRYEIFIEGLCILEIF